MIEKIKYRDFDAVRITNKKNDELIVLTQVGPRIISFRPEGKDNFFYENINDLDKDNFDKDKWNIFGGTRLWISPETEKSYNPDNNASEVKIEENVVKIITPIDEVTKLRKIFEIDTEEKSFTVRYMIKNEGRHLFNAGLWALSCVKPLQDAAIYLPWGEPTPWNVKDMKYWKSWINATSNIQSKQWIPTNEFFKVAPTGEIGKIGFENHFGFLVFTSGELSFVKSSKLIETAYYPDGGCSFEVYTSKDFYEIESLSPIFTMKPGLTYSHTEKWWAGFEKIDFNTISETNRLVESLFNV